MTKQFGDLILAFTTRFNFRYDDSGTGAHADGAFFHPIAPDGFYPLGGVAINNYDGADGKYWAMCVKAASYTTSGNPLPALAFPEEYARMWTDEGTDGIHPGSCWRPVAPAGYVALGDVFVAGYNPPSLQDVICVRGDLVVKGKIGEEIYADHGSGGVFDLDVFGIQTPDDPNLPGNQGLFAANTYVANSAYFPPHNAPVIWCLNLPFPVQASGLPEAPALTSTDEPPYIVGSAVDRVVYVPFTAISDPSAIESLPQWVDNTPFYMLEREVRYRRAFFEFNNTAEVQNRFVTITTGVSSNQIDLLKQRTGISATTEGSVSLQGFDGKGKGVVSAALGWDQPQQFEQTNQTISITVGAYTALAIYVFEYELKLAYADGTQLENSITIADPSLLTIEYSGAVTPSPAPAPVPSPSPTPTPAPPPKAPATTYNTLIVPIQLSVKVVTEEEYAAEAKVDFSRMPYNDGEKDINSENAYISENFLSVPFQNRNFILKKGLHLHWTLPDTLTAGKLEDTENGKQINYPPVPDRWLVTIELHKGDTGNPTKRSWIVESNYLHPAGKPNNYNAITYPVDDPEMPFRYMGRSFAWTGTGPKPEDLQGHQYLPNLTAIGYGEPTFAAFYPNCHSVFGFYTDEFQNELNALGPNNYINFTITGWYNNKENDPISILKNKNPEAATDLDIFKKTLAEKHEWECFGDKGPAFNFYSEKYGWVSQGDLKDSESIPQSCFFYTYCDSYNFSLTDFENQNIAAHSIAIGNTGTEALSAWLGNHFSGNETADDIEKKLEAIQQEGKIAGKRLDIGPALKEAYHEKGFTSEPGDNSWKLNMEDSASANDAANANSTDDDDESTHVDYEVPIPDVFSSLISEMNSLQSKLDRAKDEKCQMQEQLYADWYKYMVATYHPNVENDLPEGDEIRYFIENIDIPAIGQKEKSINNITISLYEQKQKINSTINLFNNGGLTETANANLGLSKKIHEINFNYKPDQDEYKTTVTTQPDKFLNGNSTAVFKAVQQPNGESAFFTPHGPATPFIAISCVVRIDSHQTAEDGLLLETEENVASGIGMNSGSGFWQAIVIDGIPVKNTSQFEWKDLPKDRWIHVYMQSDIRIAAGGSLKFMKNLKGSIAAIRFFREGLTTVELSFDRNMLRLKKLALRMTAGARFWRPNDPVVLIEGPLAEPSDRYGFDKNRNDGSLPCFLHTLPITHTNNLVENVGYLSNTDLHLALHGMITQLQLSSNFDQIFKATLDKTPWHPLMLEWKVAIAPVAPEINPISADQQALRVDFQMQENFLTQSFIVEDDEPELQAKNNLYPKTGPVRIYNGFSILTPHAKVKMLDDLENYFKGTNIDDTEWRRDFVVQNPAFASVKKAFIEFVGGGTNDESVYKNYINNLTPDSTDIISTALRAYNKLTQSDSHFLSQSLAGFNAALLMKRQTMQFPIDEPIGFEDSKNFTRTVAALVGRESKFAPAPLNQFDPIRTGKLQLVELNLIDSFGQVMQIYPFVKDVGRPDVAQNPKPTDAPVYSINLNNGFLPPRFVQPARINFRWLSAAFDAVEMNDHPLSTPVCGWFVPNNLDQSILVYDSDGYALGSIALYNDVGSSEWRFAPGEDKPIAVEEIANKHLKNIVKKLLSINSFGTFIELLEKTLNQIDPESFAQHTDLALLMGRPIAVVRALINLEIKGNPACNQTWDFFDILLEKKTAGISSAGIARETNGWEKVKLPVRIGEQGKLNDGVLGYWIDADETNRFHSVLAKSKELDFLQFAAAMRTWLYDEYDPAITSSVASEPVMITMLFDPRGKAHATCGALPAKEISIPASQFQPALQVMSVTFFTRPLLSPVGKVAIPLPAEPGYNWSWLFKKDGRWQEVSKEGTVHKETFLQAFTNGSKIWDELVTKRWVTETEDNKARVMPLNQRKDPLPGPEIMSQHTKVQDLLDKGHIISPDNTATFTEGNEILEGWLKLSPAN